MDKKNVEKVRRRRGRKGSGVGIRLESNAEENGVVNMNATFKPHKSPLINLADAKWYECGNDATIFSLDRQDTTNLNRKNRTETILKFRNLADLIYQQEIELSSSSSSEVDGKDDKWMENTMRRGTLKDRIASMSVVIGTNPVHKLYALDMLLNLAGVSIQKDGNNANTGKTSIPNARVSQMAAEALTDLFTNSLLPNSRKLYGLESRPLFLYEDQEDNDSKNDATKNKSKTKRISSKTLSPRILLLWRYEEMIKYRYISFISQNLGKNLSESSSKTPVPQSNMGSNSLEMYKLVALRNASSLMRDIPEGEQILLSMIVNKIGDPSRKVAAAAAHQLRLILEVHPVMTVVITREVQQLAHRPHLSSRALYNCIIFLNQIKLSADDEAETKDNGGDKGKGMIIKDQKTNNKPSSTNSLASSLVKTYFQLFEVAIKKGRKSSKKGAAIPNICSKDAAMNGRLLSALLTGVNRAHPYLPPKDSEMEENIDSLYRISHISPPAACTQALMLLFHLCVGSHFDDSSKKSNIQENKDDFNSRTNRFYRALFTKVGDPEMLAGRQVTLFFNLIYKAMKNDPDGLRVVAFAKRLLHTSCHYAPAIVSGVLFLVSEVMKVQPLLRKSLDYFTTDSAKMVFDSSKRDPRVAFAFKSTVENSQIVSNKENVSTLVQTPTIGGLWEVALTLHHYHPSVSKFSSALGNIEYSGDPLRDFTLTPFLDKFAFRNPKSQEKISKSLMRGESVGERRSGIENGINALSSLPVNDPDFWKRGTDKEDVFFQQFFAERAKRDELKGIVRKHKDDKDEYDDDEDRETEALQLEEEKDVDFDFDSDEEEDEEEEKFVQHLAESMLENSGNGRSTLDDEDPDMDDWSYSSAEVDKSTGDSGSDLESSMIDEIAKDDSSSCEESSDDQVTYDNSDVSDDDTSNISAELQSDTEVGTQKDKEKKTGKRPAISSFADVSEYEELIEKSLQASKKVRSPETIDNKENGNNNMEEVSLPKQRGNRKKRRKAKRDEIKTLN